MIMSDVLCFVMLKRSFEKLQAGKTDTESGRKCNALSQDVAPSELFM
jgi:hypothetical protein